MSKQLDIGKVVKEGMSRKYAVNTFTPSHILISYITVNKKKI